MSDNRPAGAAEQHTPGAPRGAGEACLVIGTPCYGRLVTDLYVRSILQLQSACFHRKVKLQVRLAGGDALITRARQNIVAAFLADPGATHLLFIDADIGFDPDQVFRLLDFDADVSSAIYPLKRIDWAKVAAIAERKQPLESGSLIYTVQFANESKIEVRSGFARVEFAGTGFFMIRRAALLAMIERYPELRYAHDHKPDDRLGGSQWRYALFNCMIDEKTGTYLSEDFAFCKRWHDMGGEIWADLQSKLTHVGPVNFVGDFTTQVSVTPVEERSEA